MSSLEARAGKNATSKPNSYYNAFYATEKSYRLDQSKGRQLLTPGPVSPGSGSKNEPGRAQDTQGQADLGIERYMGARSRLVTTHLGAVTSVGTAYGITGDGATTGIVGDIVLARPNGKAYLIGELPFVAANTAEQGVYEGLLGEYLCLAPGEDLVFVPNTDVSGGSQSGTALWIPAYVDTDFLCFRQELTMQKTTVLRPPPGKVWHNPRGVPFKESNCAWGILNLNVADSTDFAVYISDGVSDILFDSGTIVPGEMHCIDFSESGSPTEAVYLPAGHELKAAISTSLTDVLFFAVVDEYNQATSNDGFTNPSTIIESGD